MQACGAHVSQMDRLAAACGIDPIELRLLNAMETGDKLITGQVVDSVAPVARCINETVALPMPPEATDADDAMWLPGGAGRTADRSNICLLYTSPSPRDRTRSRMPSSA